MIQELYLKRAATIRRDYLKIVKDIESYEKIAASLSSYITARVNDLQGLLQKLQEKKINNADAAQQELHNIMMQTEDDINKVDLSINKLNEKIEKLRVDEVNLYKEIKKIYTDLSDDEIRQEVQGYIKKLNLS